MKQSIKNKFVLNVVIDYHENTNPSNFRNPIQNIFKDIAWLYGLDYAIDSETVLFDKTSLESKVITDIIYLRSGINTSISLREFQNVIKTVTPPFFLYFNYGVEIYYLTQASTKLYPFPVEFYRPLKYPYVEHYIGEDKNMLIHKEAVDDVIGYDSNLIPNPN